MRHNSDLLVGFGTVTSYRARSGERDSATSDMKLADYLRARGMKVTHIAGADGGDVDAWLSDIARTGAIFPLRERQAANILATKHSVLLAFGGAEQTRARLRNESVNVSQILGCDMWRGYRGPHCLTLPLERA